MTRKQLINKLNTIANIKEAKGIFSDEYWNGKHAIWSRMNKFIEDLGLTMDLRKAEYSINENGDLIRKTWEYEISGFKNPISIFIIAAGCGSVSDPLDKYDIISYAS